MRKYEVVVWNADRQEEVRVTSAHAITLATEVDNAYDWLGSHAGRAARSGGVVEFLLIVVVRPAPQASERRELVGASSVSS